MLRITGGGNGKSDPALEEGAPVRNERTSLDETADIRDIINGMVGRGYTALDDDDAKGMYTRLRQVMGDQKAQKLMTQIFIHNQREGSKPMESRIKTFYEVGSNDPEVGEIITKTKTFGQGPLAGMRESSSAISQQLTGKFPSDIAMTPKEGLKEKVMLRINKP